MRLRNLVALCTLSVTLSILGIVWSEPTILDAAPGFTNVARPVNLASPAFTGTATAENLNVSGNVGITGTLGVTGAVSLKSTLGVVGAVSITGALGVTGAGAVSGGLTVTQSTSNGVGVTTTGNGSGEGAVITGGATDNTPGATINGGGTSGALGTPAFTAAAIVAKGRAGNGGIAVKGGNTSGAWAIYAESTGTNGSAALLSGHVGLTSGSYTAGTTQTQAGATAITTFFARVTTGNANDGVALSQAPSAGSPLRCHWIDNISAVALKVYPNNSDNDTINGGAADASVTLSANKGTWFCTTDGTAWISGQL